MFGCRVKTKEKSDALMRPLMIIRDDACRKRERAEEKANNKRAFLKGLKYTGIAFGSWIVFSSLSMCLPPQRVLRPSQWAEFSKFKDKCDEGAIVDGKVRTTVDHLCAEEIYRERLLKSLKEHGGDVSSLRYWQEAILFQTVPLPEKKSYSRVDLDETVSCKRNGTRI